jgi:single-strand DNA-binding protein
MNQINLIGRAGMAPEQKGKAVTISLATSERWKDKATGERKEETQWHRITFFDKLGEIALAYVKKGDLLRITGKVTYREHEGKWYTTILASDMEMLSSASATAQPQAATADQPLTSGSDGLPF